RLHYPAFQKLSDLFEIVAVADPNEERLGEWAGRLNLDQSATYASWEEMLRRDDLDAIDIMVPIPDNFTVTETVAQRLSEKGKVNRRDRGIICEKPLAPTMAQARAARDLAEKYHIPIMIAENYRYSQEIDLIRDLVRTARVGRIVYFLQNRVLDFPNDMVGNTFSAREWRQHPDFPGGAFADSALHDLAALRHIFGAIRQVHAFGRSQEEDFCPYSVIIANLLFASGLPGQFAFYSAGREMQRPLVGLRIFGTEGMIYLEERNAGVINIARNDGTSEQISYEPQKGFENELLNFHKALSGEESLSVTPEMEFGDVKTVHSILRSIREERVVSVDETTKYGPHHDERAQPEEWFIQ
ncbi:MAG: Gfo/Idh/MocA family oxidoreductase, partial [Firmicutes bacterium]|nr:Gfo/Idh/MocA family oxidoreductase [Bacillota bacterium]